MCVHVSMHVNICYPHSGTNSLKVEINAYSLKFLAYDKSNQLQNCSNLGIERSHYTTCEYVCGPV